MDTEYESSSNPVMKYQSELAVKTGKFFLSPHLHDVQSTVLNYSRAKGMANGLFR